MIGEEDLHTPETPLPTVKSEFDHGKEKRNPQKINLKKVLRGKGWLLYKGSDTLIIDDVHKVELVCKPTHPANIKGIPTNLLAQSAALQTAFDAGLMEVISHQRAVAMNNQFSKNIELERVRAGASAKLTPQKDDYCKFIPKPVGRGKQIINKQPEIKELEITDADFHGPTMHETLEKIEEICKTHPIQKDGNDNFAQQIAHALKRHKDEIEKAVATQTAQVPPTPQPVPTTPADEFREAGHKAVDAFTDMMIAFRKM